MRQEFITLAPLPATQRSGPQCRNDKAACTATAVQATPNT